jgi:hypothetical protein
MLKTKKEPKWLANFIEAGLLAKVGCHVPTGTLANSFPSSVLGFLIFKMRIVTPTLQGWYEDQMTD